ncbi:MAG: efflux RND transporter periplasmic adaptor subunit [Planctomycetota bacterium]
MTRRGWIGSIVLLVAVVATAGGLAAWKQASLRDSEAAAASQPEPIETVTVATATEREHARMTTSIGTVMALRSITLRNEIAGTVREVSLPPGQIVEAGTLLIALDVSVEEAEHKAQEAQAKLADAVLGRMERASQNRGASEMDVDRARAERDVALAQIARTEAVIARKTIRAPFRARIGMSDVHPGQFLNEGTELTTLQGVDEVLHVDFTVAQTVAAGLREGDRVEVLSTNSAQPIEATIIAVDARVDPATRNAMARARFDAQANSPAPGASVRVRVAVGLPRSAAAVPVSALRRGPGGDHVFVVAPDDDGNPRAQMRKVKSGPTVGDEILILDGLALGEQVAASGSFKLMDGIRIAIAPDSTPSENPAPTVGGH